MKKLSKKQHTKEKVTVVIPAWNLGDVLEEAVRSVQQENDPCRILIVDNASDKPLPDIPGTERLTLTKRVTIGEARDAALRHVTTPYVLFLDGDDLLLPGTLRYLQEKLESNPKRIFAACSMIDWNPVTNARQAAPFPPHYAYRLQRFRRLFALVNTVRYRTLVVGSTLHRTAVLREAPGFGGSNYGEDWAFSIVPCFMGPILMTQRPGKLYRIDPDTTSLRIAPHSNSAIKRYQQLRPTYVAAMKEVRRRIWREKRVPIWAKILLPIIFLGQHFMLWVKIFSKPRSI